jgi:hypothetical protein
MDPQSRIPRSRGGICGVLLILLGLWGGLGPFVGPYFHFGYGPDKPWTYNSAHLYYSVIPGAAVLLAGLVVLGTRNRGAGVVGGLLAALGGAWFVTGSGFLTYVVKRPISTGAPIVTGTSGVQPQALRLYLETTTLFGWLGIVILVVGGLAVGRFSLVAARDVAAGDAESYYPGLPASLSASPPGPSQYPASAGQYPTSTGQFPAGPADQFPSMPTGQFPTTPSQYPAADPFTPAKFPDTTTSQFPPPEATS